MDVGTEDDIEVAALERGGDVLGVVDRIEQSRGVGIGTIADDQRSEM